MTPYDNTQDQKAGDNTVSISPVKMLGFKTEQLLDPYNINWISRVQKQPNVFDHYEFRFSLGERYINERFPNVVDTPWRRPGESYDDTNLAQE